MLHNIRISVRLFTLLSVLVAATHMRELSGVLDEAVKDFLGDVRAA